MASYRHTMGARAAVLLFGTGALGGCNAVLGLGDFTDQPAAGGSGTGASSSGVGAQGGGEGGAGQGGGGGPQGGGGSGGEQGGAGGGGDCEPGDRMDCYTGPANTEDVGACVGGTQVCTPQATWGPCNDEVVPTAETCNTPVDDDCDGETNEEGDGCVCLPSMTITCYTGPPGTEGVGFCMPGTGICNDQGTGLDGACMGQVLPGVETCNSKSNQDEDCDAHECVLWAVSFGKNGSDVARDLAIDGTGHVYIAGSFDGQVDFGADNLLSAGGNDAFLAKLDPQGAPLWGKKWGDAAGQIANAVLFDPVDQSVAVAGTFAGTFTVVQTHSSAGNDDAFVAKFFSDGTPVKSVRFGGPSPETVAGMVKTADKYVLTGDFVGAYEFSGGTIAGFGSSDCYVAVLDNGLGYQFADAFGSPTFDSASAIDPWGVGNVNIGGLTGGPMDMGNGQSLLHTGPGNAAFVTTYSDGDDFGYAAPGSSVKFGPDGGTGARRVTAISAGPAQKILAGTYNAALDFGLGQLPLGGGLDGFVAGLDQNTNAVAWNRWVTGPGDVVPMAVLLGPNGVTIVVGWFDQFVDFGGGQISSAGGKDIFVQTFMPDGMLSWSRQFGGPGDDIPHAIGFSMVPTPHFVMAGTFEQTVDFGGITLTAQNQKDIFVVSLAP